MIHDSRKRGSPSPETAIDVFLHLANSSRDQHQLLQEGKFLVLAATAAQHAGYHEIANRCREKILVRNPNHMLKNYSSMAHAVSSEPIIEYTEQLRKIYPLEKAEYLLTKCQAAGYRGRHEFHEQIGAGAKSAINGNGQGSDAKRAVVRKRRKKKVAAVVDIQPLPLNWPEPTPWPRLPRVAVVSLLAGGVVGLLAGLWIGPEITPRLVEWIRQLVG